MPFRSVSRPSAAASLLRLMIVGSAVVLWAAAALVWWSEDRMSDQTEFVTVVTRALRQEDSREAIAAQSWEELQDQFPLLGAVDGAAAEATIAGLLASPSWTPLFRDSARAVYLSAMANEVTPVNFNLAEDYPLLLDALLPFDPQLFGDLRPIPALGTIRLLSADEVPHLGRWLPLPGWLGPALFLSGFAALTAVIGARPSPPFALAVLGGSAAAAGLLLLMLLPWLSDRVLEEAGSEIAANVTRSLLEPWRESLRGVAVRLALAGAGTGALGALAMLGRRAAALRPRQTGQRY